MQATHISQSSSEQRSALRASEQRSALRASEQRSALRASEQHSALQAPDPYILMRAPQREEELTMTTFRWLASLPSEFRPIETGRRYARIVNRIAAIWADEVLTMDYLNSLILSDRPNRQGFPPEIGREITALSRLANERMPANLFDPWGDRKYA